MSSTYRILCLSHDPAIDVDDSGDGFRSLEDAVSAILSRRGSAEIHQGCDLVVVRWSGSIISAYCPQNCPRHATDDQVDAFWLRLLILTPVEAYDRASAQWSSRCWTRSRAMRMRYLLGVTQ